MWRSSTLIWALLLASGCRPPAIDQVAVGDYFLCERRGAVVACRFIDDNMIDVGQTRPPETRASLVLAGDSYGCLLDENGHPECWGRDDLGQVSSVPHEETFTALGKSDYSPCGIRHDGSVRCWGPNYEGETDAHAGTFVQVDGMSGTTCGLTSTGSIDCWGWEDHLGSPPAGTYVSFDAAGAHGAALDASGAIHMWGQESYGLLHPPGGTGYTQVAVSPKHACALRGGEPVCWGDNTFGQTDSVPGPYSTLQAAWRATCGLRTTGEVVCWGCIADGYCANDTPGGDGGEWTEL